MTPLGLNDVWRETAHRVERQGGILFTIAAAFLLLPGLVLYKASPDIAAMSGRAVTVAEVRAVLPGVMISSFVQLFGQLAIIAIATDEGRSTVSLALHRAFGALPRVILGFLALMAGLFVASLVVGFAVATPMALIAKGAAFNPQRAAAVIVVAMLLPCAYVMTRLILFAVIAVAERLGPIASLKASWRATKGRATAIFAVLLISLTGMLAAQGLVGLIAGGTARAIDSMVGGNGVPQFLAYVLGSAVGAAATVYFTLLTVVIWRRLTPARAFEP